jgi:hypothetical protein
VIQQGQVFKLKARSADGEPLWAYRYRVAGRGSTRLRVGGFGSRTEAQRGPPEQARPAGARPPFGHVDARRVGRGVPGDASGRTRHRLQAARLLGKATTELGGVRLSELSPEQVCALAADVPEGHRFEATQALRQVLTRAVARKLIEENPAKRGVPNPGRRCREQRPFESCAADPVAGRAARATL